MTIGVHYPFEIVVAKEGVFRSPTAVKAGVARCMKCALMGPPLIEHSEKLDVFEKPWQETVALNVKPTALFDAYGVDTNGNNKQIQYWSKV